MSMFEERGSGFGVRDSGRTERRRQPAPMVAVRRGGTRLLARAFRRPATVARKATGCLPIAGAHLIEVSLVQGFTFRIFP